MPYLDIFQELPVLVHTKGGNKKFRFMNTYKNQVIEFDFSIAYPLSAHFSELCWHFFTPKIISIELTNINPLSIC